MNYSSMRLLSVAACAFAMSALYSMESCEKQEQVMGKKESSFLRGVWNGAVAGGLEVAFNNPWVVLKNELILSKEESSMRKGLIEGFTEQLKDPKGMVKKYYKGCATGMASMAPITAFQNGTALLLGRTFGDSPTLVERTGAALGAGYIAAVLASPSDLLVLQRQNPSYAGETFMATLKRICGVNGLKTIYRGFNGTGIRDGIFTAAYKTGGEALNSLIPSITGSRAVDKILCASIAGVVAAVVSHPADVIAARMKDDLAGSFYKTTLQTAYTIVKEEKIGALFKGLTPRAFRIMLAIPFISAMIDLEVGTRLISARE